MVEFVPDDLMKEYTEKVSKYYDVEILTNDYIEKETKRLHKEFRRLVELLAEMWSVEHPGVMEVNKERDLIEEKIDLLQTFRDHRRNLIIKEVMKRNKKIRR